MENGTCRIFEMIPFNIPCSLGTESAAVQKAVEGGHISGNGPFGRKVQAWMQEVLGFAHCLLTPSCTAALEMAAILADFEPGDEVILPSFTHVGTANAFARAGANLVFADSEAEHPNISAASIRQKLSPRTKALVVVHYAGMACDMEAILQICEENGLLLIEDAAHAIGASYKGRNLGSFGQLAAFSFHETKNITCGQGGMLVVNDPKFWPRAKVIWENGTNRAAFFEGKVNQYSWVDIGSSYTLSDLNAAYLHAQLLGFESIKSRRMQLWQTYHQALSGLEAAGKFQLPHPAVGQDHNAHIFYLILPSQTLRDALIAHLAKQGAMAVFHYVPLHSSPYFIDQHPGEALPNCDRFGGCLLRLPLYHALSNETQAKVLQSIQDFF